jgi:hypothetical protein
MVPGAYDAYLAAMATAAAALVGLLFVAVSVRDDTIFGAHAMPGGEALAITAFTGLVNSLVVSLLGLIPKINIGEAAVVMAVIGIVAIVRLYRRLHTGRNLIVLAITLLATRPRRSARMLARQRDRARRYKIGLQNLSQRPFLCSRKGLWPW